MTGNIFQQAIAFLITFAVGTAGFFSFKILKMPNPALLGAMFSTGILSIAGYYPYFPLGPISFCANVVIGIMLGRQFNRTLFMRIRRLLLPVVSTAAGLILLSLLCGCTFYKLADVDLKTALIATSAGGITEMMVFGMSMNANLPIIACVQVFRVVIFLTIIPFIALFDKEQSERLKKENLIKEQSDARSWFYKADYIALLAISFLLGAAAAHYKVPTGAMLGAMAGAGGYSLFINRRYFYNPGIRYFAQIGLGLVMGRRMTSEIVFQLTGILIPTIITTFVMLLGCISLAIIIKKISKMDILTCLLCTSPAGLSQIAVFAEEIGADALTASVFHSVRIISIVSLYPWIILLAISS